MLVFLTPSRIILCKSSYQFVLLKFPTRFQGFSPEFPPKGVSPKVPIVSHQALAALAQVLLQNCHLFASWMPKLDKILEQMDPKATNVEFRCRDVGPALFVVDGCHGCHGCHGIVEHQKKKYLLEIMNHDEKLGHLPTPVFGASGDVVVQSYSKMSWMVMNICWCHGWMLKICWGSHAIDWSLKMKGALFMTSICLISDEGT